MKKNIIYLMLSLVIYSSNAIPANAQYAVACVNCKSAIQGYFDQVKESLTAIFTGNTSVQQTLDTINNLVLKPMKDALTLAQIVKSGQMTKMLITASTGGDPLLVSNPKLYLQNKGIAVTQGGIDALYGQKGIYSNSIMNSIVNNSKTNNSGLDTKLKAINQSNIPRMTQVKICNDTTLSQMASSQVSVSGDNYSVVKSNLNNSLCVGNPDTDPALAQRLMAVSNKNSSLDTFYAITSGDNAYTKGKLSQIAINDAANNAKARAEKDMVGGIKSQTTCTKLASNGLCLESTINQAASTLSKAYNDAIGSDLKTAIASFGSGAGSIIGTAFNAVSLFNQISSTGSALSATLGGGGGTGNNGQLGKVSIPGTTVIPSNSAINIAYTSSTGYAQDLANNPQSKSTISGAPMELLNQHQKILVDLKKTDAEYVATINSYNSKLEEVRTCFDNILLDFPDNIQSSDPRLSPYRSFYIQKKNSNTDTLNKINVELGKITVTSTLITNTISTINNSNSTDEITATFKKYQDQVKNQSLPDINSGTTNVANQLQLASELQISTMDGGDIFNYKASCTALAQQLNTAKNMWQR